MHTAGKIVLAAGFLLLPSAASAQTYVSLNPYSGYPGSTVSVTGFGFTPLESLLLRFFGFASSVSAVADGAGTATAALPVPQTSGSIAVEVRGAASGRSASAPFYAHGYYPNAAPSAWYLLPGQTLGYSGWGFAPGESVLISDSRGGINTAVSANGGGSFFLPSLAVIPYSWQNGSDTLTIRGLTSGQSISQTLTFGSFYPNLEPSDYYIGKGGSMSASVTGFAPGESVEFRINGAAAGTQTASGSGGASFTFTSPSSGSAFTLAAEGLSSRTMSSRVITLVQ